MDASLEFPRSPQFYFIFHLSISSSWPERCEESVVDWAGRSSVCLNNEVKFSDNLHTTSGWGERNLPASWSIPRPCIATYPALTSQTKFWSYSDGYQPSSGIRGWWQFSLALVLLRSLLIVGCVIRSDEIKCSVSVSNFIYYDIALIVSSIWHQTLTSMSCPLLEKFLTSFDMNRKFLRVHSASRESNSETSNQASKQPLLKYRMNKSVLRNMFVLLSSDELWVTQPGIFSGLACGSSEGSKWCWSR